MSKFKLEIEFQQKKSLLSLRLISVSACQGGVEINGRVHNISLLNRSQTHVEIKSTHNDLIHA